MNGFPDVVSHKSVVCFNCGKPVNGGTPSGSAPRWGQFISDRCPLCGMKTWYDLMTPEPSDERERRTR